MTEVTAMGRRRTEKEISQDVVEDCIAAQRLGEFILTDYDPLVVIMTIIAERIEERGGTFDKPKARRVWCEAMKMVQDTYSTSFEHNSFLPCRSCDQAFEPVIDEVLVTLFFDWYANRSTDRLLAIHRCPKCGGQLRVERIRTYEEDGYTPAPGSIDDDEEWARSLLEYDGP